MMIKALVWLYAYHGGSFNEMRLVMIGLVIDLTFIDLISLWDNLFYL